MDRDFDENPKQANRPNENKPQPPKMQYSECTPQYSARQDAREALLSQANYLESIAIRLRALADQLPNKLEPLANDALIMMLKVTAGM